MILRDLYKYFFLFLVYICCCPIFGLAVIIKDIKILNNKDIDKSIIQYYNPAQIGDDIDNDKLDKIINALYQSGFFKDIKVSIKNNVLFIEVQERIVISGVTYTGFDSLKEDSRKMIGIDIAAGDYYSLEKINANLIKMNNFYQQTGRLDTTIDVAVEIQDNGMSIEYIAEESSVYRVADINFINNNNYTESELLTILVSKEATWYRYLNGSDAFDINKINLDIKNLYTFYNKNGFANFNVVDHTIEIDSYNKKFYITFILDEGEKYYIDKKNIKVDFDYKEIDKIKEYLSTDKEYSSMTILEDEMKINNFLREQDLYFLKAKNEKKIKSNNKLDINYNIIAGKTFIVRDIIILGNNKTIDSIILNNMLLAPGDIFSEYQLEKAKLKLISTGIFKDVKVEKSDIVSIDSDYIDIIVTVKEKNIGTVALAVTYGLQGGFGGNGSFSNKNLFGRAIMGQASFYLQEYSRGVSFYLNDPYFIKDDVGLGIGVTFDKFKNTSDENTSLMYESDTVEGFLTTNINYTPNIRHDFKYGLRSSVKKYRSFSNIYMLQLGFESNEPLDKSLVSSLTQKLSFNFVDNTYYPRDGFVFSIENTLYGPVGDESFVNTELEMHYYYLLNKERNVVFEFESNFTDVFGYNNYNVSADQQGVINYINFRGLENAGPTPAGSEYSFIRFGGKNVLTFGPRVLLPLDGTMSSALRLEFFSDFAYMTEPIGIPKKLYDFDKTLRASAGVSILFNTPIGIMAFDFGYPFLRGKYDPDPTLFKFTIRLPDYVKSRF